MMKTVIRVICVCIVAAVPGDLLAAPQLLSQVSIVSTGAAPFFNGGTDRSFAFGDAFTPIFFQSAPGIVIQGDTYGLGRASAGTGSLGVYSRAAQGLQGGTVQYYSNIVETNSRAQFKLDDFIVTPLAPGNPQTFVNLFLRFSVAGQMANPTAQGGVFDTALINNFPTDSFASVDTQLYLDILLRRPDGSYSGSNGGWARVTANTTNAGPPTSPTMFATGAFDGKEAALQGGVPFLVEALFIGVPVNQLLEMTVGFRSVAQSAVGFPQGGGQWQGNGVVAFDQTLTFATDAVATLPAGFTVNSPGGNIANNIWTATVVPLPGTLLLLGTGLAVLSGRRRLRRKIGS